MVSDKIIMLLFDYDGIFIDLEFVYFDLWKDILLGYDVELSEDFYCEVMVGILVK